GWPSKSNWETFDDMWYRYRNSNYENMAGSCSWMSVADDSSTELSELKSAIKNVSLTYSVDPRFTLSIFLEEIRGCVRVWSTDNGVYNPGLMQSCDGSGTCNNGVDENGDVQNPCTNCEIREMIIDGVDGTDGGSCALLVQDLQQLEATDVSMYYKVARLYNSGTIDPYNLDNGEGSNSCYACDIANRLTGWVNAVPCCNASTGDKSC
ncbi:hypothetical protein M433DRAFT_65173, partial [Acidomyces richmondensis BFW]